MGCVPIISKTILLTLVIVISLLKITEASWQGPIEMISGTWGGGNDQFGIKHGDTNDVFAGPFYVLADGTIIIRDVINGRRKVYSTDGSLTKIGQCPHIIDIVLYNSKVLLSSTGGLLFPQPLPGFWV